MSRLGDVKDMFASGFRGLDHVANFVLGAIFPIAVRLIEGAPLTLGQYAGAYAVGVLVVYLANYRLNIWDWAWDQFFRRRPR